MPLGLPASGKLDGYDKAGKIALDSGRGGVNLQPMKKVFHVLIAASFLPLVSCGDSNETARKPVGPQSESSDMPWNRPTGPEGAGALGILDGR